MKMEISHELTDANKFGEWSQNRFTQVSNAIVPANDGSTVKLTESIVTILQCCNRIKKSIEDPEKLFLNTAKDQVFHHNVIEVTENTEFEIVQFTINNGDRVTVKFDKMLTCTF